MPNWVLPEYIADVLPHQARKIEQVRRTMLDAFASYGYELVIPPMLEYLESLLTGVGKDTDMSTFKLVDQLSGKTMGLRADMTTQVARIAAQTGQQNTISRLCYVGSVLHTRPLGLQTTREPLQAGAEIFGCSHIKADAEIQSLAISALTLVGLKDICLSLSHVGVLKAIIATDPLAQLREAQLFDLLETKDMPTLMSITQDFQEETRSALLVLPELYGDITILEKAKEVLPDNDGIKQALSELEFLAKIAPCDTVTIDLADLHGYHYHNGIMFAAYVNGLPNALARGGRYDHVAEAFGRSKPATGFSVDIRELARLLDAPAKKSAIAVKWENDPSLFDAVNALRRQGETVIYQFANIKLQQEEFICDRQLVKNDAGVWTVE